MDSVDQFVRLLENLCKRPAMCVLGGSYREVCAYVSGYAAGCPECPLSSEGWGAFSRFVCIQFGFPEKYIWPYVIEACSKDEKDAIERLRAVLTEFSEKTRTMSLEEIVQEARLSAAKRIEGEAEKVLRHFLSALLRGNRDEIEPLIQEHPDASILWQGAYPPDVAAQLDALSNSEPIARIPEPGEDGEVLLITADFPFPIGVRQIDGQWRVNVDRIVALREGVEAMRREGNGDGAGEGPLSVED